MPNSLQPASLPAFLPYFLPYFLPACLTSCLPALLLAFLPFFLSACLNSLLPALLPASLPYFLPSCLPACLTSCLSTYLPSCLPACLLAFFLPTPSSACPDSTLYRVFDWTWTHVILQPVYLRDPSMVSACLMLVVASGSSFTCQKKKKTQIVCRLRDSTIINNYMYWKCKFYINCNVWN